MPRQAVTAPNAGAIGPYSHAVWTGDLLYLSGQAALDPSTGALIQGDIRSQTAQCFRNLFAVLAAAGLTPDHVIKVNVYLTDMADFAAMNSVYETQFSMPFPARTTIQAAALPMGAHIEIEMIARRAKDSS